MGPNTVPRTCGTMMDHSCGRDGGGTGKEGSDKNEPERGRLRKPCARRVYAVPGVEGGAASGYWCSAGRADSDAEFDG
ncbi:hypothetical protein TRIUR3_09800 [Triticum urartu]|uniref:Uncharacterized protein n=1 Tax=Triticum urartu TaxID=4572 RepID=M8AHV3_TRIUA|nr:hypothetical protein TRIUR3_09800 [Triticum urartu]